jgi:ribosomal protein S18 acetylase RimI-like enzyme
MEIRPFRASDCDTLKAITAEAFAGVSIDQNIEKRFGTFAGHDWRWRKARHIDGDVASPLAAIWIAEDERGEIIGYITTHFDHEAGVGHISNMAIRQGLRGQGIGRKLIEYVLERFRQAGLPMARIETLDQNEIGNHLYMDCGFEPVARQIHYAMRL